MLLVEEVRNSSPTILNRLLGITEHPKDTAPPCTDQKPFLLSFSTAFWSQTGRKKQSGRKRVEKVNKNCIWSAKGKTIFSKCSFLLNYRLEIVGDESVTSIEHYDEFYVNLLFDRFFIDRCAHIWVRTLVMRIAYVTLWMLIAIRNWEMILKIIWNIFPGLWSVN